MSFQRILITGGCGFIGANLVDFLLKDGNYQIRLLDNLSVGKRGYIETLLDPVNSRRGMDLIELAAFEKNQISSQRDLPNFSDLPPNTIQLLIGDIRNPRHSELACESIGTVLHLAAHTRVMESLENPHENFETNTIGTFNFLEASRKNGVKKFVFASSNAAVGEQTPPINEEMIPKPLSPYGASKLAGEALCSGYFQSYGLGTVALRFANAYGPHSDHKTSVISEFRKRLQNNQPVIIYGDGAQTRDFVHAHDICNAIFLVLNALDQESSHASELVSQRKRVVGEVFQIATEKETSILELSRIMLRIFKGNEADLDEWIIFKGERRGEIRKNFSDITKARERLGFRPKVDLEFGLKSLIGPQGKQVS
jgi:UDP-glucose 4-epimerase